jgi:UDP-N-acetylglucosamine 2-epimerase (non-hydrolysing)
MTLRVLTVFGTRPEAIKLAPLVRAFAAADGITHATCVSGQHREMLDQVLSVFQLTPEYDLNLMKPGQTLDYLMAAALTAIGAVMDEFKPDWVVVQGDTATAFAAALAGYYRKVKVAHVEAGLRTGNIYSPWPEEGNRKLIGQITTLHLAPTETSANNLRREAFPEKELLVTGNTVIDALQWVAAELKSNAALRAGFDATFNFIDASKRLILVTGHRRENFEGGLEHVCRALAKIAARGDVEIVYPVHLNPVVQATAKQVLGDSANVHLIAPQDYFPFVYLMQRAYMIVTDSGGIQEEAPGLGKPVLVTRDTTERPEAITAGTARLVGTNADELVRHVMELLDDPAAYAQMAQAKNPFGDGKASARIVDALLAYR